MRLCPFAKCGPDDFTVLARLGPKFVGHSCRNEDRLPLRNRALSAVEASTELSTRYNDKLREIVRLISRIGIDVHAGLQLIPCAAEFLVVNKNSCVGAVHQPGARLTKRNDLRPVSIPEMKRQAPEEKSGI